MAAHKIRAIARNDAGEQVTVYVETIANQVICTLPDGSTVRLDELLVGYADEINASTALINALTGIEAAGAANTYPDLPPAGDYNVGDLYIVRADSTHGGKSTVYEVVRPSGVNLWQYLRDLEISLDDY